MPDIEAIIKYLDVYIENHDYEFLYAPDANKILSKKGLLNDDETNSGKPLRVYLRKGLLPHALQATNRTWVIPHSQSYDKLLDLLAKQTILWTVLNDRLSVVNYLNDNFQSKAPQMEGFMFFSNAAHQYYRGVVIDLSALFGKGSNSNKISFHQLLTKKFNRFISKEAYEKIDTILKYTESIAVKVQELRDSEYAHYDFKEVIRIRLYFDLLDEINELFKFSRIILDICGNIIETELATRDLGTLDSLKKLVNQFNQLTKAND